MSGILRGQKVLIVEDDVLTRFDLISLFETAGCVVTEAANALEARKAAAANSFALVSSDHSMPPGETGYELMRFFAQQYPAMRRMMISGTALDNPDANCQSVVPVYISKPYQPETVISMATGLFTLAS